MAKAPGKVTGEKSNKTTKKGLQTKKAIKKKVRKDTDTTKVSAKDQPKPTPPNESDVLEQPTIERQLIRQFIVRLVDTESGQGAKNIEARIFDISKNDKPESIGCYQTNVRGTFVFPLAFSEERAAAGGVEKQSIPNIRIEIFDRDGGELERMELSIEQDHPLRIEIRIPTPMGVPIQSQAVRELNNELTLNISQQTLNELEKQGITTLADLRGSDVLSEKQFESGRHDENEISMLASHSQLELLTKNSKQRAALIDKGYSNLFQIANTPLHVFLGSVQDGLAAEDATELYSKAEAQTAVLKNIMTGLRVNAANSAKRLSRALSAMQDGEAIEECPVSESALSPTAYFADLTDYAYKHLSSPYHPEGLTLDILADLFHQPFSELPISSRWVNREVRQVRIAVEALRSYVNTPNPINQPALEAAEQKYRRLAYETLLNNVGTSYTEMQLMRSASAEQREAVAERLGIDSVHLDELAVGAYSQQDLTEPYMDRLFGLPDTTRDPLSTGVKSGDPNARVARWIFEGAAWNRNTDKDGVVWGRFIPTDSNSLQVLLYRDQAFRLCIASGESDRESRTKVIINEVNGSGLTGRIDILQPAEAGEAGEFSMTLVPSFLAWKFDRLREIWTKQDWPDERYDLNRLPLIDPDLITEYDLRKPEIGQTVFEIWRERRNEIDILLVALEESLRLNPGSAVEQVLDVQLTFLDTLLQNLRNGEDVNGTISQIESYGLSLESFTRLMELKQKLELGEALTDAEWEEGAAILAGAVKKKTKYAEWITQERAANVIPGPKDFWLSTDEPVLRKWLASQVARQAWKDTYIAYTQAPIVDPDVVSLAELVSRMDEQHFGGVARELWIARNSWINDQFILLEQGDNYNRNLSNMITDFLGLTPEEWQVLALQYESGGNIGDRLDQLTIPYNAYEYLIHIDRMLADQVEVTTDNWLNVYNIFLQVRKVREYGAWRIEEKNADNLQLSPDVFKSDSKVTEDLTAWRATADRRREWEDLLNNRIAQDQIVIESQMNMVIAVEENALTHLREGLVEAVSLKWGGIGVGDGQFNQCFDMAIGGDGSVYVTDHNNHRIQKIDKNGNFIAVWGEVNAGVEPIYLPWSIAVDNEGYVYVTDEHSRVLRFDTHGHLDMVWGNTGPQEERLNSPRGITVDANGFVYVADTYNHCIRKYTQLGISQDSWGGAGNGDGMFSYPGRMAVDHANNIYIADMYNHRIQWFHPNGEFIGKLGGHGTGNGQLIYPGGVAVDGENNIYVADTFNNRIQKYDREGNYVAKWGGTGTGDGNYNKPSSVVVDASNNIYVVDRMNHRIQKICLKYVNEKKGWILNNLLVDSKLAPCQTTTRLGHAISTFQALVRAARIRQLQIDCITFQATEYFEEEWKWIGLYGNWRVAMFVFLYPEIVLLPTLRRPEKTTPDFYSANDSLRMLGQVNPGQITDIADSYANNINAISNLDHFQACWSKNRNTGEEEIYVFAIDRQTRSYYWRIDTKEDTDLSHYNYWRPVPNCDSSEAFIGAVYVPVNYYLWPFQADYIFFVSCVGNILESGVESFRFRRFDLRTRQWDTTFQKDTDAPSDLGYIGSPILIGQSFTNMDSRLSRDICVLCNCRKDETENETFGKWRIIRFNNEGEYISHYDGPPEYDPSIGRQSFNRAEWFGNTSFVTTSNRSLVLYGYNFIPISSVVLLETYQSCRGMFVLSDQRICVIRKAGSVLQYNIFTVENSELIPQFEIDNWQDVGNLPRDFYVVENAFPLQSSSINKIWVLYRTGSGDFGYSYIRSQLEINGLNLAELIEKRGNLKPSFTDKIVIKNDLDEEKRQARKIRIEQEYELNEDWQGVSVRYLDELYYGLPICFAQKLMRARQFSEAIKWLKLIYDFTAPMPRRKIYPPLEWESRIDSLDLSTRPVDWLRYPLNPHGIAETRAGAYSRYTLLVLIRCLLDYADSEYTRDTAESLSRARDLYEIALALLDVPDFGFQVKLADSNQIGRATQWNKSSATFSDLFTYRMTARAQRQVEFINDASVQQLIDATANLVDMNYKNEIERRFDPISMNARQETFIIEKSTLLKTEKVAGMDNSPNGLSSEVGEVEPGVLDADMKQTASYDSKIMGYSSAISPISVFGVVQIGNLEYCTPDNPLMLSLRLRGEINLHKLRSCRNIAGLEREIDPYSAEVNLEETGPILAAVFHTPGVLYTGSVGIRPTQYRYQPLINRAKELVNIAQQMEATMLSALEMRGQKAYNELKARQDVQVARAGVRLQDLRITSAEHGVNLAKLQREMSQIQLDTYDAWINDGLNVWEQSMITAYGIAATSKVVGALFDMTVTALQSATAVVPGVGGAMAGALMGRFMSNSVAIMAESQAQIASVYASYERRMQEWELQKAVAQQNVLVGEQQITLAQDNARITRQELNIAEMQANHAEAIAEFLTNEFTNEELYDWMSSILENVYSYFLQQATSIAKLAENQLAFERHEIPSGIIQPDYWDPPSEGQVGTESASVDRRGLTGSARLLRDIYQLDQYRFDTEKRKHQLSKTISLSQLTPAELQRFRETGVITFATPMELFDRDFPGHYLRLLKRVRISVLALIPQTEGIHATLTNCGVSRVVVGGYTFSAITVRRDPESVALTSPHNATGLFELTSENDMLLPFEGNGVDTLWEFRMPKSSNHFNYQTITDVLLTIEYTALDSDIYRQQVLAEMDRSLQSDRGFSFKQQFPDQWYHLCNPQDEAASVQVGITIDRNAFPPNIDQLKTEHLLLHFARDDDTDEIDIGHLYFFDQHGSPPLGGSARTSEGRVSTRSGNASSWLAMTGRPPMGRWELELPMNTVNRIRDGKIDDILFVISFSGQVPAWPQ